MLRKYPDLATVPPFKWLYDVEVKDYFENISQSVEATEVARIDMDMEQQIERKQVLLASEQSIQSQTSVFMKDLPSKIASEVMEEVNPFLERNNQERVQLLLNQAANISTMLGPSYSLTINGPDEPNK